MVASAVSAWSWVIVPSLTLASSMSLRVSSASLTSSVAETPLSLAMSANDAPAWRWVWTSATSMPVSLATTSAKRPPESRTAWPRRRPNPQAPATTGLAEAVPAVVAVTAEAVEMPPITSPRASPAAPSAMPFLMFIVCLPTEAIAGPYTMNIRPACEWVVNAGR
jgi:hypothetical protein